MYLKYSYFKVTNNTNWKYNWKKSKSKNSLTFIISLNLFTLLPETTLIEKNLINFYILTIAKNF